MGGRLRGPGRALAALACLALGGSAPAAAQEEPRSVRVRHTVLNTGTTNDLFTVSFPDERTGYAAGIDGTIVATTDGGATWTARDAPLNRATAAPAAGAPVGEPGQREHITGITFLDALNGHFVTRDGSVLSTDDGGATWARRSLPPPTGVPAAKRPDGAFPPTWQFNAVHFVDREHGWAVGPEGMILATSDAGRTWAYQGNQAFGELTAVRFTDPDHGHAVGYLGQRPDQLPFVTVATADGGRTWEPRESPAFRRSLPSTNFAAVWFVDAQRGHVVGGFGRIVVTRDGGRRWRLQRGGGAEALNGVAFSDHRRGLAVGVVQFEGYQRSVVYATDDGGENWTSSVVPGQTRLWGGVDFADADTAYAVGCGTSGEGPCRAGMVLRIDFPTPAPVADEGSPGRGRTLLIGAGGVVLLAGAVLLIRRWRYR